MEFDDEIREFLIESNENLANLDREIVQLEQNPSDPRLISSAFRTIHTIKGTCGFFGFSILGSVTHITENILSQVRDGQRELTPELISLVLEAVDAVKGLLAAIESNGREGEDQTGELRARLEAAHRAPSMPREEPRTGSIAALPEPESKLPLPALNPVVSSGAKAAQPAPVCPMEAEQTTPPPDATPDVTAGAIPDAVSDRSARSAQLDKEPLSQAVASPDQRAEGSVPSDECSDKPGFGRRASDSNSWHQGRGRRADDKMDSSRDPNAQLADSTIRVDVALLNRLMNLVGELVLARNQLLQDTSSHNPALQQTSQRLNLITSELQAGVMKTRMQPIDVVWNKLPRVVRDLAAHCGKKIRIEMEGAGTELDKTIIEAIKDPLTHIVRNSCDHGIELPEVRAAKNKNPEGLLLLRSFHEGGVVNIEISDDGAGIDTERIKQKAIEKGLIRAEQAAALGHREALNLIFLPGFSTAAAVTSISGRGVGMDVVKTNIEKIGGSVEVLNRAEGGTTMRIRIPLTLAIIPGLVVSLRGADPQTTEQEPRALRRGWKKEERFIIPQANLLELVRVEKNDEKRRIQQVHGAPIFHHRGRLLPLLYLDRLLGCRSREDVDGVVNIVVLQAEHRQIGLVVDRIWDTQEIVVKPLGRQLKGLACYVGATIMGDGKPALILDVAGLSRLAGLTGQAAQLPSAAPEPAPDQGKPQMILLFSAGRYKRLAVPLMLVDRLEEISTSTIEHAAGRPVLHYRGDILPLISLAAVLDPGGEDTCLTAEHTQIVVFSDGSRRLGLIVDQIVDIVNEAMIAPRAATTPGLLGSVVLGGKITDLIDVHALVALSGENWLEPDRRKPRTAGAVLLLDPPTVAREMIHQLLRVQGYQVLQASTVQEALAKVSSSGVLVASPALGEAFLNELRRDRSLTPVPVIALTREEPAADSPTAGSTADPFDALVPASDRTGLLSAVASLLSTSALEVVA